MQFITAQELYENGTFLQDAPCIGCPYLKAKRFCLESILNTKKELTQCELYVALDDSERLLNS